MPRSYLDPDELERLCFLAVGDIFANGHKSTGFVPKLELWARLDIAHDVGELLRAELESRGLVDARVSMNSIRLSARGRGLAEQISALEHPD